MINYKTNANWFKDIIHLSRSWTMTRVFRATLLIGVYTAALAAVQIHLMESVEMNLGGVFSLIAVVLSIILVFRTNSAYDRWWEGRKQWGALVNHCRNLAITANTTFPEDAYKEKHQMAVYISNFCIAFKEHLRDGTKLEELINVSEKELTEYASKGHVPNHISLQIHMLEHHMHLEKKITPEDHLNFKPQLQALLDILGACERIKKTPIPFSYNVFLKIFISIYGLLLPFALIPQFEYWAIPLVMIIFFAFIGLELMAEEIEEPFGLDCNDLPTGQIAHNIKNNVFEILENKSSVDKQVKSKEYEKVF
jgi:putative membrane protein